MKKFWMISMLLIAALFVISCGDGETTEEEQGGHAACTEQGAFRCQGDYVQKCDQEEWKNFQKCEAGETCNATSGTCEAGGNTEPTNTDPTNTDPTNTDPTNTDPTNTDPTTDPGNALTCGEIYECMVDCGQDGECQQACYDKGSANGQSQIMALLNCLNTCSDSSTTDEEFQECANSQCSSEISGCEGLGGGAAPDDRYNAPYGSLALNFSIDQIWNASDGQQSTVGSAQAAFATGTYGNSAMPVTPSDAYMIQSSAMYQTDAQYGNSLGIQQIPVYVQGNQGVGGNPVVILSIEEANVAVGELNVSLYQGAQAMLYVVDVNWTTGELQCIHAFGEGSINITNVGDIANHGGITLNGNATLYSPKNYNGNGDISDQLGMAACEPVM